MAAISLSIAHGVGGMQMSDYTVGVLAPNADDIEIRYNTTDTQSKNISRLDVVIALRNIIRILEAGGAAGINIALLNGGAAPPPLV